MKRFTRHMLVLVFALLPVATARGQGTGVVPSADPVYADIERLSDLGVLRGAMLGQRPYSRREIARIARVTREYLDSHYNELINRMSDESRDQAELLLQRIEERFADAADRSAGVEPYFSAIDGGVLSGVRTDLVRRAFPAPFGGGAEATIDPIDDRRLGPPVDAGNTLSLEIAHRLEFGDWLSIQARERIDDYTPLDTNINSQREDLLLATVRARLGNAAVTVGRQQITWAQRENFGLFLASDAPALDGISLSSDHPFALPGFLHSFGQVQSTIVLADLGASVARSHSELLAYKVSIAPSPSVELGGTFMNHFGGEGGRPSSFGDRLIDFLPFVDVFRKHNYTDTTRVLDVDSDKLMGMDGRIRLDRFGGVTLLGEFLMDDFDVHRIKEFFTEEGSQSFALIVPAVVTPGVSVELSAKHMGPLTYTHTGLRDGITTRGRLLGDELGPDAKSFAAKVKYQPSADLSFSVEGRSAIYSNNIYQAFYSDPAQTDYQVQKEITGTNELRDIGVATMMLRATTDIGIRVRAAGERIRNADFLGGRRRDFQLEASIILLQ